MSREAIALQMWNAGKQPSFSHNIAEFLTCGYGKLSDCGEFQFPLYPAEEYLKLNADLRKSEVGFVN